MHDGRARGGGGRIRACLGLAALAGAVGCASPGQPRPPSLHLPEVVTDLSAERVGDGVRLRWTTPATTTDKLPVPTAMIAVICRETAVNRGSRAGACTPVSRLPVYPGVTESQDALPPELAGGATAVLGYRVEISNGTGRSAGRSAEAFSVGGSGPAPVQGLSARAVRRGVRLEWRPEAGESEIELDRREIGFPAGSGTKASRVGSRTRGLPGPAKDREEVHLSAGGGGTDAGGTVDRSVEAGASYRYTAERVRTVEIGGRRLTARSGASTAVTVEVVDTFPPQAPQGLEAVPSLRAGGGTGLASTGLAGIDLSWRPGAEADLLGYNVYRMEVEADGTAKGTWRRLNGSPVAVPSFEDREVRAGARYRYQVTAVDSTGNESTPGNEVQETAPNR